MDYSLELLAFRNQLESTKKELNCDLEDVVIDYNEYLTVEEDEENANLADLNEQLQQLKEDYAKAKRDNVLAEKELANTISEKKSAQDKKLRRRDRLEKKITSRKKDLDDTANALTHLKSLVANVKLFTEHYAIGLGGYNETDGSVPMIYFTQIDPENPKIKYYMIFSELRLRSKGGSFKILKVDPTFPEFEDLKNEMNEKQNLGELIAQCLEYWKAV